MSSGSRPGEDAARDAPEIPGYEYVRWLGSGGFADVFLYQQQRPSRPVAVKVLRAGALTPDMARHFEVEADLMARVSTHPYIVTILGIDTAPDGRPFIAMEHYPNPHFGVRSQDRGLDVAEVLRVGIQLSSALQAAHDARILHRDVKPANVLTSAYGNPGLTDFGIAGVRNELEVGESLGMSVAYAAPEVLAGASDGDERSDVYSLGATLFTLLAGRSPYSRTGDNQADRVAARVLQEPVPLVPRADVPASLGQLLATTMAKDPDERPDAAVNLALRLQRIERELQLPATQFAVATLTEVIPAVRRDEDRTVFRELGARPGTSATSGAPVPVPAPTPVAPPAPVVEPAVPAAQAPTAAVAATPTANVAPTAVRLPPVPPPRAGSRTGSRPSRRPGTRLTVACSTVVVALAVGAGAYALSRPDGSGTEGGPSTGTTLVAATTTSAPSATVASASVELPTSVVETVPAPTTVAAPETTTTTAAPPVVAGEVTTTTAEAATSTTRPRSASTTTSSSTTTTTTSTTTTTTAAPPPTDRIPNPTTPTSTLRDGPVEGPQEGQGGTG